MVGGKHRRRCGGEEFVAAMAVWAGDGETRKQLHGINTAIATGIAVLASVFTARYTYFGGLATAVFLCFVFRFLVRVAVVLSLKPSPGASKLLPGPPKPTKTQQKTKQKT